MSASVPAKNPSERRIGILVVDDDGLIRDALQALLSRTDGVCVVDLADCAVEAVAKAIACEPDIVLMDVVMPGLSCFEAIRRIRSHLPDTKFILVSGFIRDSNLENALRTKVEGFVTKSEGIAALMQAIRTVMAGRVYYSKDLMKRLVPEGGDLLIPDSAKTRLSTLNSREREILHVLAKGLRLKEVGVALGISHRTADKAKTSLMIKLDIHDRVELSHFAIREGIVQP